MEPGDVCVSRRRFLSIAAATASAAACRRAAAAPGDSQLAASGKALIAITLDLEMSRNFPTWETTHWDYEKGNLNDETKRYAVEAARRVKSHGGRLHFFALGQTLEQTDVGWLKSLADDGHPIGNHTYDHVNIRADKLADVQYKFRRAPWLIAGRTPIDVVRENIRLCDAALRERLGIDVRGFRTPGGFPTGLDDRPDLRRILRELGYPWISSRSARGPAFGLVPGKRPPQAFYDALPAAQAAGQPYAYDDGLVEIPMSFPSDITAFRAGRWELDWFLDALRIGVAWAIEHGGVFDFLAHPSCLYVTDPKFQAVELICDLVARAGDKAALADLDTIARRVSRAR